MIAMGTHNEYGPEPTLPTANKLEGILCLSFSSLLGDNRYEEDGRKFWQKIVAEATGCKDPALLDDLYEYYTTDKV